MSIRSSCALTLAVWLLVGAPRAHAQAPDIQAEYDACIEDYTAQSNSATAPLLDCLAVKYERWDEELNAVYQSLRRALDADGRAALLTAQRAWLAFRDAEFALLDAAHADLGAMGAVLAAERRAYLVEERWHHLAGLRDELVQD